MKRIILYFLLLTAGGSCTRHLYYAPGMVSMPEIRHQGDWSVEAGICDATGAFGWQAAAAYSPLPYTLVTASAQRVSGDHSEYFGIADVSYRQYGSGHLYEGGMGAYWPVSAKNALQLTMNYARGGSDHDYDLDRTVALRFSRWSAVTGASTRGKRAHMGLAFRMSYVDFQSARIQIDVPESEQKLIQEALESNPIVLPELSVKTGVHFGPVDLNCQLVFGLSGNSKQFGFADNTVGLSVAYSPK